jgi:hypothetical protein
VSGGTMVSLRSFQIKVRVSHIWRKVRAQMWGTLWSAAGEKTSAGQSLR